MPIDARIPLGVRAPQIQVPDFAGIAARNEAIAGQRQDREQRATLMDLQRQRFEAEQSDRSLAREERAANAPLLAQQRLNATQRARAESTTLAALEARRLLSSGDIDGTRDFLANRIADLEERKVDSRHTRSVLAALVQDPDAALQMLDREMDDARTLGILAPVPRGKLLTPDEEAQQGRLRAITAESGVESQVEAARRIAALKAASPRGQAETARAESDAQKAAKEAQLSPAERKVDEAYAKDYVEWRPNGGSADVEKSLAQLDEVVIKLKSGKELTGPARGLAPDFVRRFTNPEAVAVKNAVEEVVQRNLRIVLGSQFTEEEGIRLIERAFNVGLEEEENAKRVGRLREQIRKAADAKNSAADYFEQNGTLKGWTGKLPKMSDFNPGEGNVATTTPLPGAGGDIPEGTIATNAAGDRVMLQNGRWIPL